MKTFHTRGGIVLSGVGLYIQDPSPRGFHVIPIGALCRGRAVNRKRGFCVELEESVGFARSDFDSWVVVCENPNRAGALLTRVLRLAE